MLATAMAAHNASAQEQMGVPACDTFIAKYEACISTKVPAEHQPQFRQTIAQMRSAITPMASSAPDQAASVCRQIEGVVKQQTAPMNCTW
jgi:hypothetical protein